jgi:hypothetical protein
MASPKKKKKAQNKSPYDENGKWKDEKRLVIGAIRRLFRQAPQFKEVHEASRVEVPKYNKDGALSKKPHVKRTCEVCGELFSSTNIAIDHIEPMVPIHLTNDDLSYNEIVSKIICDKSNLQRICNPKKGKNNKPTFLQFCHQKKTHEENFMRKKWQQHFEKSGIVSRADKDMEYIMRCDKLEHMWKRLYEDELRIQLKEMEEKEERKRLREEKKLLKLK